MLTPEHHADLTLPSKSDIIYNFIVDPSKKIVLEIFDKISEG